MSEPHARFGRRIRSKVPSDGPLFLVLLSRAVLVASEKQREPDISYGGQLRRALARQAARRASGQALRRRRSAIAQCERPRQSISEKVEDDSFGASTQLDSS